MVAAPG
jgi:hypothetical protein